MPDTNPATSADAANPASLTTDSVNQSIVNNDAVAQENAVKGNYQMKFPQGNLVESDVLIYDNRNASFAACMFDYAKYVLKISTNHIFGIGTFDELFSKISEYQTIARLYIFTHGAAGEIIVDKHQLLTQLISTYQKDINTQVTEFIQFEGCNIGNAPFQMNEFRKFLRCPNIMGRNCYHILFPTSIIVTANGTINRSSLETPAEFIFTETYLDQMEATEQVSGSKLTPALKYHWFREVRDEMPPLARYDQKEYFSMDDCSFITLKSSLIKNEAFEPPNPGLWNVSVIEG